jgi:hypothetical protein
MASFISGMVVMGLLIASLFFFRFWKRTGDILFLAFSFSFCLFALNQALPVIWNLGSEERSWTYLLRLAGFLLIILAVLNKSQKSNHRR